MLRLFFFADLINKQIKIRYVRWP